MTKRQTQNPSIDAPKDHRKDAAIVTPKTPGTSPHTPSEVTPPPIHRKGTPNDRRADARRKRAYATGTLSPLASFAPDDQARVMVLSTMGPLEWIVLLMIAGVCGTVAQRIAGYSHAGCFGSIILGFVGALLGVWLSHQLHLPEMFTVQIGHSQFPIIWSVIGASLFVGLISALRGR